MHTTGTHPNHAGVNMATTRNVAFTLSAADGNDPLVSYSEPSALDDDNYNCLSYEVLQNIAAIMQALESAVNSSPNASWIVYPNSPILIQGEGFRYGWLKPVDDYWAFVPDIKETE